MGRSTFRFANLRQFIGLLAPPGISTYRLRGEEDVSRARHQLVVLGARGREDEGPEEPGAVADVVVGVVLGQVEDVLREQRRLLRVGQAQLGRQVDGLQGLTIFQGQIVQATYYLSLCNLFGFEQVRPDKL